MLAAMLETPNTPKTRRSSAAKTAVAPDQPSTAAAAVKDPPPASGELNTAYLETLLGYNARRAALSVIGLFLKRMAPFGLKPVEFSVLTVIAHNPGVTSRQICSALDILPPNLVGLIKSLDQRGLIVRKAHPSDGRSQGLHLSAPGKRLQREAQVTASALEEDAAHALSKRELDTLKTLLRKVYQG